jgi:hypothetical protein
MRIGLGHGDSVRERTWHSGRSGYCKGDGTVDRGSRAADLEQFDNDLLLGPGRGRARAAAPGCPAREVGCARAAAGAEARIGTGVQQGFDSSRTPVPDGPVQWRDAACGGCTGISTRLNEKEKNFPLACRVPARRTGNAHHRRMQWFGAPAVSGPNAGAACD